MRLSLLVFCSLLRLAASADERSGPQRVTLVEEPWGTVYAAEGAKVVRVEEGRWRIDSSRGPVTVQRQPSGWLIQAANQNLRVDQQEGGWRFLFNGGRYRLRKDSASVSWTDAQGETLSYTVDEGGTSVEGVGPQGKLSISTDPSEGKYEINSSAGKSSLNTKKKLSDGVDLEAHPGLTPGVLLDNEVIGVFIPLPCGQALPMLGWSQAIQVANQVPFPESGKPLVVPKPDPLKLQSRPFESSPTIEESLQKKPANDWSYPDGVQQAPKAPLQSLQAPKGSDPLNLKPKPFNKPQSIYETQTAPKKGSDPLNLNPKPFSKPKTIFEIQNAPK